METHTLLDSPLLQPLPSCTQNEVMKEVGGFKCGKCGKVGESKILNLKNQEVAEGVFESLIDLLCLACLTTSGMRVFSQVEGETTKFLTAENDLKDTLNSWLTRYPDLSRLEARDLLEYIASDLFG